MYSFKFRFLCNLQALKSRCFVISFLSQTCMNESYMSDLVFFSYSNLDRTSPNEFLPTLVCVYGQNFCRHFCASKKSPKFCSNLLLSNGDGIGDHTKDSKHRQEGVSKSLAYQLHVKDIPCIKFISCNCQIIITVQFISKPPLSFISSESHYPNMSPIELGLFFRFVVVNQIKQSWPMGKIKVALFSLRNDICPKTYNHVNILWYYAKSDDVKVNKLYKFKSVTKYSPQGWGLPQCKLEQ